MTILFSTLALLLLPEFEPIVNLGGLDGGVVGTELFADIGSEVSMDMLGDGVLWLWGGGGVISGLFQVVIGDGEFREDVELLRDRSSN